MKKIIAIQNIEFIGQEVAIKWTDNTESFINLIKLRDNCPCAFCSGEKDVLGNVYKGPQKVLNEIAYQTVNFETIGHYAIRFFWGDRHADGLYTFEMLQKLGEGS